MREADLIGSCGRAWLLRHNDETPNTATICGWLVNRPGAHPHWQWWVVALITLKDLPGIQPARKTYPEAEYELLIYAIDPTNCPAPEPDNPNGYPPLLPIDVMYQFHGISEKVSQRLVSIVVQTILVGRVSPDQDFRRVWDGLLTKTLKDLREENDLAN